MMRIGVAVDIQPSQTSLALCMCVCVLLLNGVQIEPAAAKGTSSFRIPFPAQAMWEFSAS